VGWKGVSLWLLGFSRRRRKGFRLETGLALPTEAVRRTLSFGREINVENPDNSRCWCGRAARRTDGQDRGLGFDAAAAAERRGTCAKSGIEGVHMQRLVLIGIFSVFFALVSTGADDEPLQGFTRESSVAERQWEAKFRAIPSPENQREYMRRLSACPHHVGSPYDKENAEWILSKFKEWGWNAQMETFDVLFPTPKERLLEMVEPTRFTAKLQEPVLSADPTSNQQNEQLPTYNAYS